MAQVPAVIPRLEEHAKPCGAKAVIALLAPLVSLYGVADKSEAEWKSFWGFYTEALGDQPVEAVQAAVRDYVHAPDSQFFPKPGPLRALVDKHTFPIRRALAVAKRAMDGQRY